MKTIRIYSDESRHKNERFLLLGGVWIEEGNIPLVQGLINNLREDFGYTNSDGQKINFLGELKWTKVSDKYYKVYEKLVDIFFYCIEKDIFRSCIMLVDTQDPIVLSYDNLKKDGYFKFLYQLYYHNSKIPAIYKIYPDHISDPRREKVDLEKLDRCLDAAFMNKFAGSVEARDLSVHWKGFVNNITSIDSKKSDFIQILDVVMGGIGFFQNRHFKNEGAKKAKVKLMKHIFNKMVYSGTMKIISKKFYIVKSTKFNIWIFKPNNKKDHQC